MCAGIDADTAHFSYHSAGEAYRADLLSSYDHIGVRVTPVQHGCCGAILLSPLEKSERSLLYG